MRLKFSLVVLVAALALVVPPIVRAHIAANSITTAKLNAGAVTADKIAAGTITADEIAAGTITGDKIAAGTIDADKLNVSTLSAITANLGTVTAGSISLNSGAFVLSSNGDIDTTANANFEQVDVSGAVHTENLQVVGLSGATDDRPACLSQTGFLTVCP